MKNVKKWIAIFACVCMFAGCGNQTADQKKTVDASDTKVETTETEILNEDTNESVEIESKEETKEVEEDIVIDRSHIFEMLPELGMGWNLGNTFDAFGNKHSMKDETYWGNPETTKEMIEAVAAQGFKTIRVPVTWADHVSGGPDYTIDQEWIDRVQVVIDWCMESGLYVIIDTHHDPDSWLKPTQDGLEEVTNELSAIWAQVAERFKDYDHHLIFEGMNEPRMKGTPEEWSGGTKEGREAVNTLNMAFVDTVRASGGNNADRLLIICTYGNSVNYNTLTELEIPKDNNIAVAVHLYTPYYYTYDVDSDMNVDHWDGSMKKDIISNMQLVNQQLVSKGVPAIITEMGVEHVYIEDENGKQIDNTGEVIKWIEDYAETANRFGMPFIWWDNGNYKKSGEEFAIFDRENLTWYDQEIADALIEHAFTGEE